LPITTEESFRHTTISSPLRFGFSARGLVLLFPEPGYAAVVYRAGPDETDDGGGHYDDLMLDEPPPDDGG
jgi:hypothetical protein